LRADFPQFYEFHCNKTGRRLDRMAIEAVLVFAFLALPLHWLVMREFSKDSDPDYLRQQGVVIVSESALQEHSAPVGEYRGHPIWGSVRFMGMDYRFDHVVEPRGSQQARETLGPRELFLDPGLVYVTD
jgi:hypothetical protein